MCVQSLWRLTRIILVFGLGLCKLKGSSFRPGFLKSGFLAGSWVDLWLTGFSETRNFYLYFHLSRVRVQFQEFPGPGFEFAGSTLSCNGPGKKTRPIPCLGRYRVFRNHFWSLSVLHQ